jgi:hypothetical protein
LATVDEPALRLLDPVEEDLLAALAVLVGFARRSVERERDYKREIAVGLMAAATASDYRGAIACV